MSRTHHTATRAPNFTLHLNEDSWPDNAIIIALLADIRKELEKMNDVLQCRNTTRIPRVLARIDKRLAQKLPLR